MPVYLTLQPIRRAAGYVAIDPGGLLPHLFTLTTNGGGCFLSRYSTLANGFPLGNMALCVARTFLLPMPTSDRPPHCLLQRYKKIDKPSTVLPVFCKVHHTKMYNTKKTTSSDDSVEARCRLLFNRSIVACEKCSISRDRQRSGANKGTG